MDRFRKEVIITEMDINYYIRILVSLNIQWKKIYEAMKNNNYDRHNISFEFCTY